MGRISMLTRPVLPRRLSRSRTRSRSVGPARPRLVRTARAGRSTEYRGERDHPLWIDVAHVAPTLTGAAGPSTFLSKTYVRFGIGVGMRVRRVITATAADGSSFVAA